MFKNNILPSIDPNDIARILAFGIKAMGAPQHRYPEFWRREAKGGLFIFNITLE